MTKTKSIERLPFDHWPPALQQQWARQVTRAAWKRQIINRYRRAAERLLYLTVDPPTHEIWEAFDAALSGHYASCTARSYGQEASYVVRLLWPEEDWTWLVDRYRRRRAPPPERSEPGQAEQANTAFQEWPRAWREAWMSATSDPIHDDVQAAYMRWLNDEDSAPRHEGCHPAAARIRRWSNAFRARIWRGGAMYAAFLREASLPVEVSKRSVRNYLAWLRKRDVSDVSIAMYIEELAIIITLIVEPDVPRPWLTGFSASIKRRAKARRRKPIARPAELVDLGTSMMREAEAMCPGPRAAVRYRDGLLLAYQARRAHRVSNLADMVMGRTVTNGRAGLSVDFPVTKNGSSWHGSWPADLAAAVERYLQFFRPLLSPRDSGLWTGRDGRKLTPNALTTRMSMLSNKHLGRRLPPHLYRDALATEAARLSPEAVRPAAAVLGHSEKILHRHYCHAVSFAAARALEAALAPVRRGLEGRQGRSAP